MVIAVPGDQREARTGIDSIEALRASLIGPLMNTIIPLVRSVSSAVAHCMLLLCALCIEV